MSELASAAESRPAAEVRRRIPHILEPSFWNYISGIFVGVATNLGTSGHLNPSKATLVVSCLGLSYCMFRNAFQLDRIAEDWNIGLRAEPFLEYAFRGKHRRQLLKWGRLLLLVLFCFLLSVVWYMTSPIDGLRR